MILANSNIRFFFSFYIGVIKGCIGDLDNFLLSLDLIYIHNTHNNIGREEQGRKPCVRPGVRGWVCREDRGWRGRRSWAQTGTVRQGELKEGAWGGWSVGRQGPVKPAGPGRGDSFGTRTSCLVPPHPPAPQLSNSSPNTNLRHSFLQGRPPFPLSLK